MSVRTIRRTWFAGLWLLLPWPLFVFGNALVPAVRYVLLGLVAAAVAIAEGASGPVGLIVLLFFGMGIATTSGCWILAYLISRCLNRFPVRVQHTITWLCLGIAFLACLALDVYRTPFGRALRGGLIEVLS